jgi:hypothetical protein
VNWDSGQRASCRPRQRQVLSCPTEQSPPHFLPCRWWWTRFHPTCSSPTASLRLLTSSQSQRQNCTTLSSPCPSRSLPPARVSAGRADGASIISCFCLGQRLLVAGLAWGGVGFGVDEFHQPPCARVLNLPHAPAHPPAVHGVASWFDVLFDGSQTQRWLSTAPGLPITHW